MLDIFKYKMSKKGIGVVNYNSKGTELAFKNFNGELEVAREIVAVLNWEFEYSRVHLSLIAENFGGIIRVKMVAY